MDSYKSTRIFFKHCMHYLAPSTPKVMDSSSTSTSIYLAWSQQPDDFVKGINVTAAYTGPCSELHGVTHITSLNSSSRQVNLMGLEEYSNYSITVVVFNDAGSNFSQVVNVTTKSLGKFIKHYFLTTVSYHIHSFDQHPTDLQMLSEIAQQTSLLSQFYGILLIAFSKIASSRATSSITEIILVLKP